MPNFSADKENKMILTHRTAAMITSYCMYKYSEDKNDFYITNSLYWEPCSNDKFMHLVEKSYDIKGNRKILNDVKVKSLYHIDIDPKDSNAAPYFKENSFWDLNGEKWKFENKKIFNATF